MLDGVTQRVDEVSACVELVHDHDKLHQEVLCLMALLLCAIECVIVFPLGLRIQVNLHKCGARRGNLVLLKRPGPLGR
jgi:hypothetical protein